MLRWLERASAVQKLRPLGGRKLGPSPAPPEDRKRREPQKLGLPLVRRPPVDMRTPGTRPPADQRRLPPMLPNASTKNDRVKEAA
jgi:hypothetical protein